MLSFSCLLPSARRFGLLHDDSLAHGSGQDQFCFINLAFSGNAAQRCLDYLAGCMSIAGLQQETLPPQALLPGTVWQDLIARLQKWNTIPLHQVAAKRLALRAILIELFACLLQARFVQPRDQQPKWLTELLVAMRSKENMTAGLAAMRSLSGKSHEHLCRALRQYTGQSPELPVLRHVQ